MVLTTLKTLRHAARVSLAAASVLGLFRTYIPCVLTNGHNIANRECTSLARHVLHDKCPCCLTTFWTRSRLLACAPRLAMLWPPPPRLPALQTTSCLQRYFQVGYTQCLTTSSSSPGHCQRRLRRALPAHPGPRHRRAKLYRTGVC